MWTLLHWVDGPWPGKLALASRPRGGDWLPDEMAHWHKAGIDTVVSLLTMEEETDLDLQQEGKHTVMQGMEFISFPILDRQVPSSETDFMRVMQQLDTELTRGRNIVLHCRQGIGRTGLLAAGLLVMKGFEPEEAVSLLSRARGLPVPETAEQRQWLDRHAISLRLFDESTAAAKPLHSADSLSPSK